VGAKTGNINRYKLLFRIMKKKYHTSAIKGFKRDNPDDTLRKDVENNEK